MLSSSNEVAFWMEQAKEDILDNDFEDRGVLGEDAGSGTDDDRSERSGRSSSALDDSFLHGEGRLQDKVVKFFSAFVPYGGPKLWVAMQFLEVCRTCLSS
eukprot:GFYU01020958.1.p3 GENE.GFYU01020958.1~~GFYU01020958.1.p3  ORF type:complete len:100 (-),score=14.55 GFYU01020958.1:36-335(-)